MLPTRQYPPAIARAVRQVKRGTPGSRERLAALRQEYQAAQILDAARRVADEAPELTDDQAATLRVVLGPVVLLPAEGDAA